MKNKIEDYKKAILPHFENVFTPLIENGQGTKQDYRSLFYSWEKERKDDLSTILNIEEADKIPLKTFIQIVTILLIRTSKLFELIHRYDKTNPYLKVKIANAEYEVYISLKSISNFSTVLKHNFNHGEYQTVIKQKQYFKDVIERKIDILQYCGIEIYESPLNKDFNIANQIIQDSIDTWSIDILLKSSKDINTTKKEMDVIPVSIHPPYNPNFCSKECFELFTYLFDNYYNGEGSKRTQTLLINIWFYLKEYDPTKYPLYLTKKEYKKFLKAHYKINLNNEDRPENYEGKAHGIIDGHRIIFEEVLK